MRKKIILIEILLIALLMGFVCLYKNKTISTIKVDVEKLTYNNKTIKTYTQDDYEEFLSDYNNNKLPKIYITKFIYDGAGMYRAYDLDDYIEDENHEEKVFEITAFNINTTGNIEFTGNITGAMILVNTNDIKGDINIILNNLNLDTDSKKVPAIYVYNKNINYTDHKVTIKTKEGTKNYIEGGKFKKVSLIAKEDIENHTPNADSSDWYNYYEEYSNYYGIYTKDEIENILFAKVQADNEDLMDKDPYYFYKAAGAISSDIDLYFEGTGYLKVTSKNKEGIETKGNLTFSGSTGDYEIYAEDDCLNTTTKEGRNALAIDVNSLQAIVSIDADEGDAIDSNGSIIIDNGNIIAISHPGADSGLDSNNGTYINGGTVIATGDMYDQILSDSKQNFMVLSFSNKVNENETINLKDSDNRTIFEYTTDRSYTYLVYSSSSLIDGTYTVYNGETLLGYSSKGNMGGGPNGDMEPPGEKSNNMGEPPVGGPDGMEPPEKPDGMEPQGERPEMPQSFNGEITNFNNKDFVIEGVSNIFNGIGEYKE